MAGVIWCLVDRPFSTIRNREQQAMGEYLPLIFLFVLIGVTSGGVVAVIASDQIREMNVHLPCAPPSGRIFMLTIIVVAAGVNSFSEELVWRGFYHSVTREMTLASQFLLQVSTFGISHWAGIPGGVSGGFFAAVFSAIIFGIRRRCGFCSGWLVHFVTDVVVFYFVFEWAMFSW